MCYKPPPPPPCPPVLTCSEPHLPSLQSFHGAPPKRSSTRGSTMGVSWSTPSSTLPHPTESMAPSFLSPFPIPIVPEATTPLGPPCGTMKEKWGLDPSQKLFFRSQYSPGGLSMPPRPLLFLFFMDPFVEPPEKPRPPPPPFKFYQRYTVWSSAVFRQFRCSCCPFLPCWTAVCLPADIGGRTTSTYLTRLIFFPCPSVNSLSWFTLSSQPLTVILPASTFHTKLLLRFVDLVWVAHWQGTSLVWS